MSTKETRGGVYRPGLIGEDVVDHATFFVQLGSLHIERKADAFSGQRVRDFVVPVMQGQD